MRYDAIRQELLSARDTAKMLGLSRTTLWRRVQDGTVPAPLKVGRLTRWRRADIDNFISGDAA